MISILSLQNLENEIPDAITPFKYFANKSDLVMETKELSMNELEDTFYSLKGNKNPDYDDTIFSAIKKCFNSLCEPLNLSTEHGFFPDDFITRVTPIYKGDDSTDIRNYRPLSVFLFCSKILVGIMYNCLCKHLIKNNTLNLK